MRKFRSLWYMPLVLTCLVACDSRIPEITPSFDELIERETNTVPAIQYRGRDSRGRVCHLYVSAVKEASKKGTTKADPFLLRVDYPTADGSRPHAGRAQFYRFDTHTQIFYPARSRKPLTTLSLFSMDLKDPTQVSDPYYYPHYVKQGSIKQYLRAELEDTTDLTDFHQALTDVLDDKSAFATQKSAFDTIELVSLGFAHGSHYHRHECVDLEAHEVVETAFELVVQDKK